MKCNINLLSLNAFPHSWQLHRLLCFTSTNFQMSILVFFSSTCLLLATHLSPTPHACVLWSCDTTDCSPPGSSGIPLSVEFSRQEYWSGLPFPFPICQILRFPTSSLTPLSCMNSLMLTKVWATNKGLPTLLTLIGFLTSMNFPVSSTKL